MAKKRPVKKRRSTGTGAGGGPFLFKKPHEAITWMNKRYAVVSEGNRVLVISEALDPVLRRKWIVRYSFADIKKLQMNRRVITGPRAMASRTSRACPTSGSKTRAAASSTAWSLRRAVIPPACSTSGGALNRRPSEVTARGSTSTSGPISVVGTRTTTTTCSIGWPRPCKTRVSGVRWRS